MKTEAILYEKLDGQKVRCRLCSHHCTIAASKTGFCGVRENIEGTLFTRAYGRVIASNVDPIEKKPLYHVLPGTRSFSIATIGCNFRCGFCQNWQISQVDEAGQLGIEGHDMRPEDIVEQAKKLGCKSIAYTYTEPTIFFEYAYDTARLAKEAGLCNVFVTNGYMTKEALDTIRPYLDAANVDLKSFSDEFYKSNCKARLQPVLDSIAYMKELGIWVEVTTLVIPGQNDSHEQLNGIAEFIAGVDPAIPWHISRFHPNYKFTGYSVTPIESLRTAREIGEKHGLRYIYLGNVPEASDMYCYNCKKVLIRRSYAFIEQLNIKDGKCSACGVKADGIWD